MDPAIRKSPLSPYAREAELKTLDLLDKSLTGQSSVNETIESLLRSAVARDIEELLPHLQNRGEEYAAEAKQKLTKRADDESQQMRGILESQRKHILATTAKDFQRTLPFHADELRQLEADRRRWNQRLTEIEGELDTEPARIRDIYQVRAQRIEPVGIVYLWPGATGGR